jgi:hypothetical protein
MQSYSTRHTGFFNKLHPYPHGMATAKAYESRKSKHQPHKNYENIPSGALRINEMNKPTLGLYPHCEGESFGIIL